MSHREGSPEREKRMLQTSDHIVIASKTIKRIFNMILHLNLFLRHFTHMGQLFVYSSQQNGNGLNIPINSSGLLYPLMVVLNVNLLHWKTFQLPTNILFLNSSVDYIYMIWMRPGNQSYFSDITLKFKRKTQYRHLILRLYLLWYQLTFVLIVNWYTWMVLPAMLSWRDYVFLLWE